LIDTAILFATLSFGVAPWVAFFYGGFSLPYVSGSVLIRAYLASGLYLVGLAVARPRSHKELCLVPVLEFLSQSKTSLVFFGALALWLIRGVLALRYGIFVSGTSTADRLSSLPYVVFAATQFTDFFSAAVTLWSSQAMSSGGKFRRTATFLVASEILYALFRGRRTLVFILALFLAPRLFAQRRLISSKRLLVLGATAYLLFQIVFPFFLAFRNEYRVNVNEDKASYQGVTSAASAAKSAGDEILEDHDKNMSERPLIIRFPCLILEKQQTYPPLYGALTLHSLYWSLPRLIAQGKLDTQRPEQMIQSSFNLPLRDDNDSYLAYAVADFGVLGGLASGYLFGLILRLAERTCFRIRRFAPSLSALLFSGFLLLVFQVEASIPFLITRVRDAVVFGSIWLIITVLVRSAFGRTGGRRTFSGVNPSSEPRDCLSHDSESKPR
jgi:hypothetical protein